MRISALDASEKCWSGVEEKMPEISKELNLLRNGHVSTFSRGRFGRLNPKILMDEESWKTWKSNQNVVMDEKLSRNGVMDEKFVNNFVMGAKLDPKIEMDLAVFETDRGKILQRSYRKLVEESI